jgi:hypothetical protein
VPIVLEFGPFEGPLTDWAPINEYTSMDIAGRIFGQFPECEVIGMFSQARRTKAKRKFLLRPPLTPAPRFASAARDVHVYGTGSAENATELMCGGIKLLSGVCTVQNP